MLAWTAILCGLFEIRHGLFVRAILVDVYSRMPRVCVVMINVVINAHRGHSVCRVYSSDSLTEGIDGTGGNAGARWVGLL